jgi:DNA primase small subunit
MNNKTKRYLKFKFQKYYQNAKISFPPDYTSREWGFIPFDLLPQIVMKRHKSFYSKKDVADFLHAEVPAHVYHSVAYYKDPGAPKMNEKHWLKADLIFDLDADHLPNARDSYVDMLNHVKKESIKLLDFLQNDFGFLEKEIKIIFSGGRGYHFHITNKEILTVDSHGRREIIDYISAIGLDTELMFSKKEFISEKHSSTNFGWEGKISKHIKSYLYDISKKKDAIKHLMEFDGIGKKKAQYILDAVRQNKIDEWQMLSKINPSFKTIINKYINDKKVDVYKANVDEPVTTDIKRLIRLPGSLHGKTGMCVKTIPLKMFENFDPLNDAIVFGNETVELKVMKPFKEYMKNRLFEYEEGVYKLPEYIAIYLMCKGIAEYGNE